jgi:TPP-dependent pyruvate/acetoin dehydrogenase alpha subunit
MEPIRRTRLALIRAGLATEEELDRIRADCADQLRDVAEALDQVPQVPIEEIAATVHGSTPWGLLPDRLREPSWKIAEHL